jgi:Tfp pilus assembly pilus retraction ATPase PilT
VLLGNPTVRQKIREGEDSDLPGVISRCEEGMQSFTHALAEMVKKDWITVQTAMDYAPNRDALSSVLKGVEVKSQGLVGRIKAGSR